MDGETPTPFDLPNPVMKIFIASVIILVAGVVVGFYARYSYDERHVTNQALEVGLQQMESSSREEAGRAIRAIELIDSGKTPEAVQVLSHPIVEYYYVHALDAGANDEQRSKTRAMIEQLMSTNKIVAAAITNSRTNYPLAKKTP
jgi:hypothetical protein